MSGLIQFYNLYKHTPPPLYSIQIAKTHNEYSGSYGYADKC